MRCTHAVDYEATVFVNGQNATFHRGGYFAFTVDITDYLHVNDTNELLVFVHDPTDSDSYVFPIGKQTLHPSHIFYTPCSGIWQSVWIESAPSNYITDLYIAGTADGQVNATVSSSGNSTSQVKIEIVDRNSSTSIATHTGTVNTPFTFSVPSVSPWSPDSPTLYNITVSLGDDEVGSYTGFRTVSRGIINGIQRPLLNGEFIFPFGTLDQGFWPDGIYTPPNREAMVYDLQTLKKLGFNMLRKHIKVETALFYQACDELGLLVFQDMPALRPLQTETFDNCSVATILPDDDQQAEFARQLDLLIVQQRPFTSIFSWIVYNEGWGQITSYYPEFGLTDRVKQLDPTRLVDSTTGWYDHGAGDYSCGSPFYSIQSTPYDPTRIGIQGEFGGIGNNVSIEHLWSVQAAIDTINQTYEIDTTLEAWNYRGHRLLGELLDQVAIWSCSGGIWTQTTDVEGEVNGLMTYDRRILRPDVAQWQSDISHLYSAATSRTNASTALPSFSGYSVLSPTPYPSEYPESTPSWSPNGFEYSATPPAPFMSTTSETSGASPSAYSTSSSTSPSPYSSLTASTASPPASATSPNGYSTPAASASNASARTTSANEYSTPTAIDYSASPPSGYGYHSTWA
ncbi:hypothetical protein B0A55_10055 [Friedmanniomyces simplex]|uniref:Glycoside hydrolase family 2 catalytic domain-containing protein n=1 Tax=Friedmanniomyces simplex TaxID=329884 RepID=A0A4U0X595_9PEZI|nr:hypothetical protein B0A55_10718 [Friedmanniomyces simplex]TKA71600.1 hypothetical protein B0A55_10055 [Friedmanniomyces simplex]